MAKPDPKWLQIQHFKAHAELLMQSSTESMLAKALHKANMSTYTRDEFPVTQHALSAVQKGRKRGQRAHEGSN